MTTTSVLAVTLLALTACVVVYNIPKNTGVAPELDEVKTLFESWKGQHNKLYQTVEEEAYRYGIFQANLKFINEHNANKENTYTLAINHFADLTTEEFGAKYNGYQAEQKKERNVVQLDSTSTPSSVNWVKEGAVTPVKNQGDCGSCWSFSTTGSTEGINYISTGKLLSFSEQQLMDCSWLYGDKGCNGGLMDNAFRYLVAKGSELESDYPYQGQSSFVCKYSASKVQFQISGYQDVQPKSIDQLEAAVAQQPVSIAVQANQQSWQFYNGGVVSSNCGQQLDHGVLVVGYDNGSTPYWLVKNSWGSSWGESGYIRILKSDADLCGVLDSPSYPTK